MSVPQMLQILDGVKDAYEFSLVAVPAQRKAGVSKCYTGERVYEPDEDPDEAKKAERAKALRARFINVRAPKN